MVADSIAFLGHPDDTVAFREDVIPARDSRGRFYLVDAGGTNVYVFGTDGRLLSQFGKPGRGPGEFSGLRAIFPTPGDSLLVIGAGVVHVISPQYVQVREYRTGGGDVDEFGSTLLADRRILLMRGNHQFVLVAPDGGVQSRVTLHSIDTSRCNECGERIYREARVAGALWSAPLNLYRVELHDTTGVLLRRYSANPAWFKLWSAEDIRAEEVVTELARPRVMGVREDSDGLLWTHTTLIEHPDELRGTDEDNLRQMARLWSRMITRVDAISDSSRQLLTGTDLPGLVLPMNDRDHSAQLLVDESGDWSWKILRLRVVR